MRRVWCGAAAAFVTVGVLSSSSPRIPLVPQLTVVRAWRGGAALGDYEGSITVDAVNDQSVRLVSIGQGTTIDTRMTRATMRAARTYREVWTTADPEMITGATSMIISSALLGELAAKGATQMTIIPNISSGRAGSIADQMTVLAKAVMSDSTSTGTPYSGTLRLVEPHAVPFAVLINGQPSSVAAMHARGTVVAAGDRIDIEMYVLDDPALPIVLQSGVLGGEGGRVIKITYPDSSVRPALEQALATGQPVDVYEIYFDYNSATITPQSESALRDIADILQRHPDWRLAVVGHTDSIGGTGGGNKGLSARRAAAVKDALSGQHGIAPSRLTTAGAGSSHPIVSNATLEGRARNRRVELRRL